MKSLIVVDSLNGVRRNYNLFNKKKIDILSLDFFASEFIKVNFKKNSTNIFDFYKKNERMKIFSSSIKTLLFLLNQLDKKFSKKISNTLGIKNTKVTHVWTEDVKESKLVSEKVNCKLQEYISR